MEEPQQNEEWPKEITVYSHTSKSTRRNNAREVAAEGSAAYDAIRGLGHEIETTWRVYEDGTCELLSAIADGNHRIDSE